MCVAKQIKAPSTPHMRCSRGDEHSGFELFRSSQHLTVSCLVPAAAVLLFCSTFVLQFADGRAASRLDDVDQAPAPGISIACDSSQSSLFCDVPSNQSAVTDAEEAAWAWWFVPCPFQSRALLCNSALNAQTLPRRHRPSIVIKALDTKCRSSYKPTCFITTRQHVESEVTQVFPCQR